MIMAKKRIRKPTITQEIMASVAEKLKKYTHDSTRKQYNRQMKLYVKFCREKYNAKTFDECRQHVQAYSDFLQSENYSPSTIHTYLAAICCTFEINLETIQKPIRHVSDYSKGRKNIVPNANNDLENPKHSHLTEFQKRVGIRRHELKRLRKNDFTYDESGKFCIVVRRGKGGKKQYQRVLEEDIQFIQTYFDSANPNARVFDEKLFQNNLNLHKLRAEAAKRYYFEQLKKINENPAYRVQLEKEIRLRWETTNFKKNGKPKQFREEELRGIYYLRGKNRKLAISKGLPVAYDKTALLATSLFKLSHFRNDVTIASYLLAV